MPLVCEQIPAVTLGSGGGKGMGSEIIQIMDPDSGCVTLERSLTLYSLNIHLFINKYSFIY